MNRYSYLGVTIYQKKDYVELSKVFNFTVDYLKYFSENKGKQK
jgi:hypothetical protein